MKTFSQRLQEARLSARNGAGLTQIELADEAQLTQAYVSQLESGKRAPTPSAVTKLAKALKIKRSQLVGQSDEEYSFHIINRKLKGLSPDSLKKIDEFVDLVRKADK